MNEVKSICIVGGGSAGWMTAGLLSNHLPKNFSLTLIESPNIPTVGVGEATLRTFKEFMERCGWNEWEWIDEVDGIYKSGIKFEDWVEKDRIIWHPFHGFPKPTEDITIYDIFKSSHPNPTYENFLKYVPPLYDTAINKKLVADNLDALGYHLDAAKLARFFINKNNESKRVNHILSDIKDVILDSNGNIDHLLYGESEILNCDFYIDCTGFKNIVSSKINGAEWIHKDNMLLGNTAIAAPVEYENPEIEMSPYTTAKCLDIGWMWMTPIQTRIGSGIVFNRNITPIEEAKKTYDSIWPNRRLKDFNIIHFEPKYNSKSWRKNVVSIGLSSGFVEPLESSGLQFIIESADALLGKIRKGFYTKSDQSFYNSLISNQYEETFDFIQLHYLNSKHKSLFWKKFNELKISPSLQYRIDQHKENGFSDDMLSSYVVFGHHSWVLLFEGVGIQGKHNNYINEDASRHILLDFYKNHELFLYKNYKSNFEIIEDKKIYNSTQL